LVFIAPHFPGGGIHGSEWTKSVKLGSDKLSKSEREESKKVCDIKIRIFEKYFNPSILIKIGG